MISRNESDVDHRDYDKPWKVKNQAELSRCAIGIRLSDRFVKELIKQLTQAELNNTGISLVLHNARGSIGLEFSPSGQEIKIGGFGDELSFIVEGVANYEAYWDRVELFFPNTKENRDALFAFVVKSEEG